MSEDIYNMLSSRIQVLSLLELLSLLALLGYLQHALVACPGIRTTSTTCVLILLLLHMCPNTTSTCLQHARVARAGADVC